MTDAKVSSPAERGRGTARSAVEGADAPRSLPRSIAQDLRALAETHGRDALDVTRVVYLPAGAALLSRAELETELAGQRSPAEARDLLKALDRIAGAELIAAAITARGTPVILIAGEG